jgi:hypothetical protein
LLTALIAAETLAPAGGSAPGEIISASASMVVAGGALFALGYMHRKHSFLRPLATQIEESTGQPAWAVLPGFMCFLSLFITGFGYYWDVAWHVDRGRDVGVIANPAHWFILVGLDGVVFAGILAVILGDRRTSTSIRITKNWDAPAAGVVLALCGFAALGGFPLDDIWHRVFGQDFTAWGPTHIQMIGGATLTTLACWALLVEGTTAAPTPPVQFARGDTRETLTSWALYVEETRGGRKEPSRSMALALRFRDVVGATAFLVGLSTLQVEFDVGVPQYRLLFQPILIALAGSMALVAARVKVGRGGALATAVLFVAVRGLYDWLSGPVMGRTIHHFPTYLAEALVVEIVALLVPRHRQITLGAVAGVGIATVGFAAEWAWSHTWAAIPWTSDLLPEAIPLVLVAGVSGGVIGAFAGRAMLEVHVPRQRTPRFVGALAWIGFAFCLALPLPIHEHRNWTADVTASPVTYQGERWGIVTVRTNPIDAAKNAAWFDVMAWQGRKDADGGLVIAHMQRQPDGAWRTDRAVPLDSEWKTTLRLQKGSSLQSLPLYLPADPMIPAPARAIGKGPQPFIRDKLILQREAKTGRVLLFRGAWSAMFLVVMVWIALFSWGIRRLDPGARLRRALERGAPPGFTAAAP